MTLSEIVKISRDVAVAFGLPLIKIDTTKHTLSLRLIIDHDIFITIYANDMKDKLNLALIFYDHRLYEHDKEGGRYHIHLFQNSDEHQFTDQERRFMILFLRQFHTWKRTEFSEALIGSQF